MRRCVFCNKSMNYDEAKRSGYLCYNCAKKKKDEEEQERQKKEEEKENLVLVSCGKCAGRGKSTFGGSTEGGWTCTSCNGRGEKFVTKCCGEKQEHCKCKLDN